MIPVKYFSSEMIGAPRISGTPGDIVTTLEACLVTGFNLQTVQSIVVTAGVATVTFGTAHGFIDGQVVLIAGAEQSALNGECRVASADTNSFNFSTTQTDVTATGTISAKVAPAGWEKVFSATQRGAFRSTNIESTRLFCYVDDTRDQYALATSFEDMTDIDSGVGASPPAADVSTDSDAYSWKKSDTINTNPRPWRIIADGEFFYLLIAWQQAFPDDHGVYFFGDAVSFNSNDLYSAVIGGHSSPTAQLDDKFFYLSNVHAGYHWARDHTSTAPIKGGRCGVSGLCSYAYEGVVYPNGTNTDVLFFVPLCTEGSSSSSVARGLLPGSLQPLQKGTWVSGERFVCNVAGNFLGREIVIVNSKAFGLQSRFAFDITGPWR